MAEPRQGFKCAEVGMVPDTDKLLFSPVLVKTMSPKPLDEKSLVSQECGR